MKTTIMFIAMVSAGIVLSFAMYSQNINNYAKGCGGSDCHMYKHGVIRWHLLENLQVQIVPRFTKKKIPIAAEMYDVRGRMVDYQSGKTRNGVVLNAPRPGRYRVMVGYLYGIPLWDSLWVTIPRSGMNIPTTRYGSGTFQFFPVHPTVAKRSSLLRFYLPEDSEVEIQLFTVDGIKVRTIFKGFLSRGLQHLYWETRDDYRRWLPEGNYLCELSSNSGKLVQTIVVER